MASRDSKSTRDLEGARKRNSELQVGRSSIDFKKAKSSHKDESSHSSSNPYGRCPNVGERYEKIGRIGEGTYGVVYKARDKETKKLVALKRCLPHHESSDGFPLTTLREINTLRQLRGHPGIVQLEQVAVSSSRSGVFLVFEYCEHDLGHLVDAHYSAHGKSPFRECEVKRLALQLLSALEFMHSRCSLHRDIKLSNLLYNSKGELRLADFGLSRKCSRGPSQPANEEHEEQPPPLTPKVVSLWYRPPEILLGSDCYNEGVDNWGAGCVIGELLLGAPLMSGKNELDQISKLFEFLGPPTLSHWPDLKNMPLIQNGTLELPRELQDKSISSGKSLLDRFSHLSTAGLNLLTNLLQYDFHNRWTAGKAMHSNYFTELPAPVPTRYMPRFPSKHATERSAEAV